MDLWWTGAGRLALLAVPAALGALAAHKRLFPDTRAAITAFNLYALYLGFPALIAHGLAAPSQDLPGSPWFWALWPAALALILLGLRLSPLPPARAGSLSLVTTFGNVAYLGLPYVLAIYGPHLQGAAALAVSIHVTLAVTLGPAVLARGSQHGAPGWRALLTRVLRQPLFWAPVLGLGLKHAPAQPAQLAGLLLTPLAQSAAPVALFLLGLYLYQERQQLWRWDRALVGHLLVRQLLAPALVLALGWLAVRWGTLAPEHARLHVLLAAMPAAITTFSMAHHAGVGSQQVAGAIVWSSLLSLAWLPLWASLAGLCWP